MILAAAIEFLYHWMFYFKIQPSDVTSSASSVSDSDDGVSLSLQHLGVSDNYPDIEHKITSLFRLKKIIILKKELYLVYDTRIPQI